MTRLSARGNSPQVACQACHPNGSEPCAVGETVGKENGVEKIHVSLPQCREERGRDVQQLVSLIASAKNTSWLFSREFPIQLQRECFRSRGLLQPAVLLSPRLHHSGLHPVTGHSSQTFNFRRNVRGKHTAPISSTSPATLFIYRT